MSRENNLSKGLLIGFLTGGIVGAAVALLYAPKSGKELRSDIKTKADEYLSDAEKHLETAKEKAIDIVNDGKTKGELLISDAKVRADELLKDAEKIFGQAKQKTTEIVSSSKESIVEEGTRLKSALKAGVDAYKESKNS
jgi:gas vesicle protein